MRVSAEQASKLISITSQFDNLFFSVGKLFVAAPDPSDWNPNCEGFVQIGAVFNSKVSYINVYKFGTYELVFQHEIFDNFSKGVTAMGDQFVAFQSDQCVIGIAFTSPTDATEFVSQLKGLPRKTGSSGSKKSGGGGFFKKKDSEKSKPEKPPKEKKEKPPKEKKEKPPKEKKEKGGGGGAPPPPPPPAPAAKPATKITATSLSPDNMPKLRKVAPPPERTLEQAMGVAPPSGGGGGAPMGGGGGAPPPPANPMAELAARLAARNANKA